MTVSRLPVRAMRAALGFTLWLLALGTAVAAGPAAPRATHVLFMGADITVEKDREFHQVEDVTPTDLIIKPGGKPVPLPLSKATDLRINETLKLAATSAGIDHLEFERAYSIGADPFDQLTKSVAMAAGRQAEIDLAAYEALQARMLGSPDAAGREDKVTQLYNTPAPEVYSTVSQSVKAAGEPQYDAIRLTFEVTPKSDLTRPYYAVIAQIRDPDSKPGQVRKWAYVQALAPIGADEVRNVLVYRSGFPPGYILEGCEVHVYNQGEELATNLSRKRVPLTADEAQEYRIVEYIGTHKGRTLPAALATTTITGEARFSLTKAQLDETQYVRVAKDGSVLGVFRDVAGEKPLQDPSLESVLKTLRFKPALKDGKPVESIAPVSLGQLATAVKPEK